MNWPTSESAAADNRGDDEPDPGRRTRLFEDVFILLCVLALWPVLLGMHHVLYQVLLYAALAGLVFILVRRVRRFSQARRDAD